jgi:hypothetical protein
MYKILRKMFITIGKIEEKSLNFRYYGCYGGLVPRNTIICLLFGQDKKIKGVYVEQTE